MAVTPVVASLAPERARNGNVADVIANRIEATHSWVKSEPKDAYSIQLLVARSDEQLRNNLKGLPKNIEMHELYMYRSLAHGRPAVNVLWGSFDSRKAAQQELEVLPASLRANRPYVRTIEGIRADIDRSGSAR